MTTSLSHLRYAFGKKVRELREAKGMTLREVARKVNISTPFLCDIEHGRRMTNKIQELADALGVDVKELEIVDHRTFGDRLLALEQRVAQLEADARRGPWRA